MSRSLEGLLVGRTLADRYDIGNIIGRGGMSVVYRAADNRLGRAVAVKIVAIPESGDGRGNVRERLRREAASAARIPPHPNVVQVYDYGTDPELDLDFIAMELLDGRDLKAAIQAGGLAMDDSLRLLIEASRGVAAGHRAGIVHRDVKPGNIFLAGDGPRETVKILDFGIAKALEPGPDDDLTRTGLLPHSPAYASPEQLDPSTRLTPSSDVYQLGLVAYELLAGERPFTEPQRAQLRAGEPVEMPERGRWLELPGELRSVLSKALEPKPGDRFQDAASFAEALDSARSMDEGIASAIATPADDATLLADDLPPIPAQSPVRDERIVRKRPSTGGLTDWRSTRGVQIAAAGLLAVAGIWGITRLGDGDPAPVAETDGIDIGSLDEEFRPLLVEASENVGATQEESQAAIEITTIVRDLNAAWVRGELDRHVAHYADRVDFYNARNAPRSRVARERGRALEMYPEREITIERTAVTFPEPDEALALVDKSWRFGGDEDVFEGSARQELRFERQRGRWRVVSERDAEVYRSERN
jgi:serine/threonine protein kinase